MEQAKEVEPKLTKLGFQRVPRDDRLYDILPRSESREKGVELWEKEENDHLLLARLREPHTIKNISLYKLPLREVEAHLLANQPFSLADRTPLAVGEEVFQ